MAYLENIDRNSVAQQTVLSETRARIGGHIFCPPMSGNDKDTGVAMAAEERHFRAPMHAEMNIVLVLLWPAPLLRLVTQWFPSSFCYWRSPAAERHN